MITEILQAKESTYRSELISSLASIFTATIIGWVIVPELISWQILKKSTISPEINPGLYSAWIQSPIPIYLKVYLFNCTNPDEVEKGMLPAFQELGPYVFQENRKKINVTLDDDSDTATYLEHITYHFRKDESATNSSLQDVVTFINVPFAGAAIKIDRDFSWPLSHVAHTILLNYKEPLFVKKTVEEILFKGWKVPFLEKMEEDLGITVLKNNTFSLFMDLNGTAQGPYSIDRGMHGDKSLFGSVVKYKNESTLSFWGDRSSYCNQIYGSDGTIYPPFIGKDAKLKIFNTEVCRSFYLTYDDNVDFEGIHGYRFTVPGNLSKEILEDEKCFCKESVRSKCLKRGATDMGPCRGDGDPVAMSGVHFYGDVDPEYFEEIDGGWKPNKEKHESFIDVEPITGTVMRVSKKLQVSLILKKVGSIKSLRKVREILFPVVWADECASLDATNIELVKSALRLIFHINVGSKIIAVLSAVFVPLLIFTVSNAKRNRIRKSNALSGTSSFSKNEQVNSSLLKDIAF